MGMCYVWERITGAFGAFHEGLQCALCGSFGSGVCNGGHCDAHGARLGPARRPPGRQPRPGGHPGPMRAAGTPALRLRRRASRNRRTRGRVRGCRNGRVAACWCRVGPRAAKPGCPLPTHITPSAAEGQACQRAAAVPRNTAPNHHTTGTRQI